MKRIDDFTGVDTEESTLNISSEQKHLTLSDSFYIGHLFQYLKNAGEHDYKVGSIEKQEGIKGALESIHIVLQSREFESPVAGKVTRMRNRIEEHYEDSEDQLSDSDREHLIQEVSTWMNLFYHNIQDEQRIPAAQTGLMDVERLLKSPDSLFSKPVWNWLEQGPKSDLRESCRAIVIGSSTASVMLSLRAVEHCLRVWHEDQTGESLDAGWGRGLEQLINEYLDDDKKNQTVQQQLSDLPPVLSNLYYLKEKRNEVSHPVESPTPQEAQRTLMIVVGTITDIFEETLDDIEARYSGLKLGVDPEDVPFEEVLFEIISQLDDGEGASENLVYKIGSQMGVPQEKIDSALHELLMDGEVYEPDGHTIKPI